MAWATCTEGHRHWGPWGAAGLLVASRGAVLLQLRAAWTHRGGTWSVPGGALERRESAVDAALREAHEELGIAASSVTVQGSYVATCGDWTYQTVLATSRGERLRLRDRSESDGHRWVPVDEVEELLLHPGFRDAWRHPDGRLRSFVAETA